MNENCRFFNQDVNHLQFVHTCWCNSSKPNHRKHYLDEEMNDRMNNQSSRGSSSNQLLVPGVEHALSQMKVEIASEFGVTLGADTTSRANGSVGGEITKRLVQMAQQQLGGSH